MADTLQPSERIDAYVMSTDLRRNEHQPAQWRREELARLTERIIRDCARVVFDNTGPRCALNVLEHFGLKDEE